MLECKRYKMSYIRVDLQLRSADSIRQTWREVSRVTPGLDSLCTVHLGRDDNDHRSASQCRQAGHTSI